MWVLLIVKPLAEMAVIIHPHIFFAVKEPYFLWRILYDMTFYVVLIIIVLNLIFGLVKKTNKSINLLFAFSVSSSTLSGT